METSIILQRELRVMSPYLVLYISEQGLDARELKVTFHGIIILIRQLEKLRPLLAIK